MREEPANRRICVILTILFAAAMTLTAELTGEAELIFPEAAALCVGAWIAPGLPWRVGRVQMVALMTLSAIGGILLVRYTPDNLALKTALGLLYTGALLLVSGSTLIPLISACILPIFLGTRSWVYPAAVFALTLIIVLGRVVLERLGVREVYPQTAVPPFRTRALHWLKTLGVLMLICAVPVLIGRPYLVAPPLLVTFAELFFPHSPLRRRPGKVWALLASAVAIGALCRMANILWDVPVTICAVMALGGVLGVFKAVDQMLPPAAAAALLAMIIPAETVLSYPPLAVIGAAIIVTVPGVIYAVSQRGKSEAAPETASAEAGNLS